ncbi:MAG: hypothetical protein AABY22_16985 [Nanoarchaeota archaeon]
MFKNLFKKKNKVKLEETKKEDSNSSSDVLINTIVPEILAAGTIGNCFGEDSSHGDSSSDSGSSDSSSSDGGCCGSDGGCCGD